jgi:hypothetical protein
MRMRLLVIAALILFTAGAMVTKTQSTFTRRVTFTAHITPRDAAPNAITLTGSVS